MKTTSQKKTEGTPGQIRTVEQVVSTTATAPQAQAVKRDERLPIDTEARKKNRTLPTEKVLALLQQHDRRLWEMAVQDDIPRAMQLIRGFR